MTTFEYMFMDGRKEQVEADFYKKEYNPKSDTYEYKFYSDKGEVVKIVPILWLDYWNGSPKEV